MNLIKHNVAPRKRTVKVMKYLLKRTFYINLLISQNIPIFIHHFSLSPFRSPSDLFNHFILISHNHHNNTSKKTFILFMLFYSKSNKKARFSLQTFFYSNFYLLVTFHLKMQKDQNKFHVWPFKLHFWILLASSITSNTTRNSTTHQIYSSQNVLPNIITKSEYQLSVYQTSIS